MVCPCVSVCVCVSVSVCVVCLCEEMITMAAIRRDGGGGGEATNRREGISYAFIS